MLNIKNPKAHELAVEMASVTGESLTDAVIHSLEERLERKRNELPRREIDMDRVNALLEEIHSRLPEWFLKEEDSTAFLYDPDTGLPA